MKLSIRFLIGLSSSADASMVSSRDVRRAQMYRRRRAIDLLSRAYPCGSAFDGTGFWEGEREPSLCWEVLADDVSSVRDYAASLARELARALDQEAIGLAFAPTEYQEVPSGS